MRDTNPYQVVPHYADVDAALKTEDMPARIEAESADADRSLDTHEGS